jgi:predicted phage tail protein
MNIFSRIFVAANRVFGAFTAAGGALFVAATVTSYVRGHLTVGSLLIGATVGVSLILVGIVYLRAPLSRTPKTSLEHDATQNDGM